MRYLANLENIRRGTFDFPIAYYHIDKTHPRYKMVLHWHPDWEIIRVIKGILRIRINNDEFLASEGQVIILQSELLHAAVPNDCIYDCMVFNPKLFQQENNACAKYIRKFTRGQFTINTIIPKEFTKITEQIDVMCYELRKMETGNHFFVQGALYNLLGLIIRNKLYSENNALDSVSDNRLKKFKDVLMYIEKNYEKKITLDELAKIACMDKKYFCSFFKNLVGKTPIEYVNAYRIECACEMLVTTNETVIEVAYNCGFHDCSYFTKIFRQFKNTTPKKYSMTKKLLVR